MNISTRTTDMTKHLITRLIDHTYLQTEREQVSLAAQQDAVLSLVDEAVAGACFSVCVRPHMLSLAKEACRRHASALRLTTTIGFPEGNTTCASKLAELKAARLAGADEYDMVLNRHDLQAGRRHAVIEEIATLSDAAGPQTLKVIFETGLLSEDDTKRAADWLAEGMQAGLAAGASRFFKTATGFARRHPTGEAVAGASEATMRLWRPYWQAGIGVKASGGIQQATDVLRLWATLSQDADLNQSAPTRFRIGASSLLRHLMGSLSTSGSY